ncbi:MAG: hypothetical protein RBS84_10355 [Kiritimatiellia bacterium]|nr:hypothetical protein [Kiritimatiellia bacterium]
MKSLMICLGCVLVAAMAVHAEVPRTMADYQIILDRQPFGTPPPDSPPPERVVPVQESFAATLILSGIYEEDDGSLRAAVVDKKDNRYFSLVVGESEEGIELLDVDYDKEEAVLKKGDEVVVLRMSGTAGSQVLTSAEQESRMKDADERRLSYAERRRQRMLARQQPVEVPKPIYTGEELERHLQDYQMEVIRQGLPPLPVQLTPDRDAQLVAEGLLPPLDEEGYEIEYPEEEYYEDAY